MIMTAAMLKRCQDCGGAFECGMGQEMPCWCSREFDPVMRLPDGPADCYCPKCLKARIEQIQAENSSPAP